MPRAQKHKMVHDVELTDVDSDSDMDRNPIRLPSGLPLDEPPPQISADTHMEVEHVCRRHLNNRYIGAARLTSSFTSATTKCT